MCDTEAAYLAGLVDGDGCFGWNWQNSTIFLNVAMTHRPTIDWLAEHFGGRIHVNNKHEDDPTKKILYVWIVNASILREILPRILPFLVTKAEQAQTIEQVFTLRTKTGKSSTQTEQRLLYEHLRKLNQKGKI